MATSTPAPSAAPLPAPPPSAAPLPAPTPPAKEYAMGEGSTPAADEPHPLEHLKDVK